MPLPDAPRAAGPAADASGRSAAHAPLARHARRRPSAGLSRALIAIGVVAAVLVTSLTGTAAFAVWNAGQIIGENAVALPNDEQLPPSIGAIEGGVNLLVVGTDSCEGQDLALFPRCGVDDDGGERNDVTMLVHISDEPRRVTVVSFPRDMMVAIPECTDADGDVRSAMSSQMLNASYMDGGLPCTVKTIEQLTGESIQFATAIRWTGVINMSDAIGGVDVCLAGDVSDGNTGLNLTAGQHTLVGAEALQFLRIRHGIGDGSDLGRISNQQQFMSSMVRKLQSGAVLSNPQTLLHLATTALSQVAQKQLVLSQSLTNPQLMVQIAMAVKDVPYEDIVFVQYPTQYASGDGASRVLPVSEAADVLFAALAANQPLTLTGEASSGYAVEVTGEATAPAPTETATADPDAAATPAETAAPAAPEERVALPSEISGQTAAQVTCTQPQE